MPSPLGYFPVFSSTSHASIKAFTIPVSCNSKIRPPGNRKPHLTFYLAPNCPSPNSGARYPLLPLGHRSFNPHPRLSPFRRVPTKFQTHEHTMQQIVASTFCQNLGDSGCRPLTIRPGRVRRSSRSRHRRRLRVTGPATPVRGFRACALATQAPLPFPQWTFGRHALDCESG